MVCAADAPVPLRRARPLEEGDGGAWRAALVAEVEMVAARIVEVDRLLDQPQPQHARVEIDRALRVHAHNGYVVDAQGWEALFGSSLESVGSAVSSFCLWPFPPASARVGRGKVIFWADLGGTSISIDRASGTIIIRASDFMGNCPSSWQVSGLKGTGRPFQTLYLWSVPGKATVRSSVV